jgi:hypothetical protein
MKETPKSSNTFDGSLNTDTDKFLMDERDYLDAWNIRNSINDANKFGLATNAKGNTLVPYTQPSGQNSVLGTYEDLSTGECYYIVWNSQGGNGATQIRKANGTTISQLATGLSWIDRRYIPFINLVDGHLLYWTDTEPRQIDLDKSNRNKTHKANIYYVSANAPNFIPAGTSIDITIFDADGNTIGNNGLTVVVPQTQEEYAITVANFINLAFPNILIAQKCFNYTEVTSVQEAYFSLFITNNNNVSSVYVPQNYYDSIFEGVCEAGRRPLNCNPTVSLQFDNTREVNNLTESAWQFRTQVIYSNNNKSVLSPASDIVYISCETSKNYIEIDFTDEKLVGTATNWLSDIKAVRIVGRPLNDSKYREIAYIEQKDFWSYSNAINRLTYNFYNDGQYAVIDDITSETQYHNTPIEALDENYSICQETFDDRLGYSKFAQDYDLDCIDAELTPTFTENKDETFSILGLINIYNPQQFRNGAVGSPGFIGAIHTPVADDFPVFGGANNTDINTDTGTAGGQYLPEAGFPIYLAGTEYLAISKQLTDLPNLSYNSDGSIDTSTFVGRSKLEAFYDGYPSNPMPVNSLFTLKNVKAGKYVLAVASHLCSFGDKLSKGAYYDLNGTLYQKTSTYFRSVNLWDGGFQPELLVKEITIEIRENGDYEIWANSISQLTGTAVNGEIFIGTINIEDICTRIVTTVEVTPSTSFRTVSSQSGYLIDGGGGSDIEDVAQGATMEKQFVQINTRTGRQLFDTVTGLPITPENFDFDFAFCMTDRNGFYYASGQRMYAQNMFNVDLVVIYTYNIEATSVTAGTGTPLVSRTAADSYFYSSDNTILLQLQDLTATIGTYTYQYIDTPVPVPNFGTVAYNANPQVTSDCRTVITGTVTDANGDPIEGVGVSFEYTGRTEKTQADGTFSVLVYGDYFSGDQNSRAQFLIFNSCCDCLYEFQINGLTYYSQFMNILPFGAGGYNNTNPFLFGTIIVTLLTVFTKKLKAGGVYNFALLHVDTRNRRSNIFIDGLSVKLPFLTEDVSDYFPSLPSQIANGVFEFSLSITSSPPAWADKLYVLRTRDQFYSDYLQFPIFDAQYVINYDDSSETTIQTTYNTFSANEIYLGFPQATNSYRELNTGSNKAWAYEAGDRVRFIKNKDGAIYTELYDVAIRGVRIDSVTGYQYFVIDALDALGEVAAGTFIEVYRPMPRLDNDQKLYFEIHTCIDILNGQYVGLPQTIDTADTYTRTRNVPIGSGINVAYVEDNSLSDFWVSRNEDIGRPNFERRDFGRVRQTNVTVYTGKWQQSNQQNNLNEILLTNIVYFPNNYGTINSLKLANDSKDTQVLLVICENKVISVYVGVVQFNDVVGTELVTTSNAVLGSYRTLAGTAGTINPESVHRKNSIVYFYDSKRKKWWKYDNNGMDAISDRKIKTLAESITPQFVISGFEDYYEQYQTTAFSLLDTTALTQFGYIIFRLTGVIQFANNVTSVSVGDYVLIEINDTRFYSLVTSTSPLTIQVVESLAPLPTQLEIRTVLCYSYLTLAYFEPDNKWETRFAYAPENYGSGGENYYAFHNGNAYLMSSNETRNNWFDVQFSSMITAVSKVAPKAVKYFLSMKQVANDWWTTIMRTTPNASYPTGMKTTMEKVNAELREGVWNSEVYRDENDPEFFGNTLGGRFGGRWMRGYYAEIEMTTANTTQTELRSVDVFQNPSELTSD